MSVTSRLADYVAGSTLKSLPMEVHKQGVRSLVNWVGCTIGGSRQPAIDKLVAVLQAAAGPGQSTVVARGWRTDMLTASLVNGTANSLLGYNDTHLPTVAHPAASVVAACLALAGQRGASGADLLHAVILGIEIQCRVGNVLVTPPAESAGGLYMVGTVGGIGAAVAAARMLGLDGRRTGFAFGTAGGQSGGLRETYRTMASHLICGEAARGGLLAALLAERDFTGPATLVEGPKGLAKVFATAADPSLALQGLGTDFEIAKNTFKPYPCGFVAHPVIDACLDVARDNDIRAEEIERVEMRVSPAALQFAGFAAPANAMEAGTSLHHWAAVSLACRAAGLRERSDAVVRDPRVIGVRERIVFVADASLSSEAASAKVFLGDGRQYEARVDHARGTVRRPMTDSELSEKFLAQADGVLPAVKAKALLAACWDIQSVSDVGQVFGPLLD